MDLNELTIDQLVSAYNGRIGCACGCRGQHSYTDAAEGERARGYAVRPEEVSLRRVANTLRTIQAHAAEAERGSGYWAFQSDTRLYIVYLRQDTVAA